MSEENPWGRPPSNNPVGGYGPPSSSNPPASPPTGPPPPPPGWGQPPTAYGGPPPGPPAQPPRRNLAAIIGIVLAVVLVIIAVAVTVIVKSNGDDQPQSADESSSTSTSDPTTDPTTDPTSDPTSGDPSSSAGAAGAISGDGYSFDLPGSAWNDAYDEAEESGIGSTLDTIIILGTSLDLAQSNILVEALSSGPATGVDDLAEQWKRNLSGADGAVPDPIDDITIDGDRAIGVRFTNRTNQNGVDIDQVCYLVLHGGNQYSIALSYPSDGDSVSEDDFAKVLDSWTWSS